MVATKGFHTQTRSLLSMEEITDHLHTSVDSSDDAIISKTLTGTVTSWNKGAEALFGYTADEMLGNSILLLMPPERLSEESFILDLISAGEKVDHFDTIRLRKDGSRIPVSVTISPIKDTRGKIVGVSKIARDISDRVKLQITERQFAAIINSSDDAIVGKTLSGVIQSWNQGAERMFGYSAEEMIGWTIYVLLPDDRKDEETQILAKLARGERIDHFETVRVRKDGRLIDVSVSISPILDKTGRVVGASKIARDISLKKQIEKQLQLTASVFSNTNEGIVIADADGVIVEVNPSFLHISGYDRAEVIGKTPELFRSSRHDPEFIARVRQALNDTGTFQGEVWSRRKDGSAYASLLTINSIKNAIDRVEKYVALIADITPLRAKQEEIEHLAHFDALTDLPNRILLADRLSQAMGLAIRHAQSLAVLYLDLDHFKEINDKYGHDTGDKLLIAVSNRMREAMRSVDTLSRIGGDEFVAVLINVGTPVECVQLAERILLACSQPVDVDGIVLQVSASIGVTMYPQDQADPEQLIRHADRALYEAKQAGRNRIHLFDLALEQEMTQRTLQLGQIEHAFVAGELALYYQPKVNMRSGLVFGAEALLRWLHPERGVVAPGEFLPIIEHHALECKIGYWVIEQGLSQLNAWQQAGLTISVSVNVSANLLQMSDFVARLSELLAKYPAVQPQSLELEILENSALQDLNRLVSVIRACQQLGVCFSVDDFGTGYSSLTYLRRLPAETLKIDQSFVRDILLDRDDLAIVQGVIALAQAFHRKVIAEGVETIEIGEVLLDLGCDLAQGYGIARPMPAALLPNWVRHWTPHPCWRARQ